MKSTYRISKKVFGAVAALCLACVGMTANAQLNPFSAQYFSNQYLGNPAMAGQQKGLSLNAGYRQLWNQIPGAPKQQLLTGEYRFGRVGVGLKVEAEQAGLLKRNRAVGSYAYHLPVGNEKELHFGLSLGLMDQRLNNNLLDGELDDPELGHYNNRETYFDGDFGIAYTDTKLNLQFALPNLRNLWEKEQDTRVANVATFYAAASYRLAVSDDPAGMGVEPKIAFRGIRGFDNIFDVGAQLTFVDRQLLLMAMYHSNKSSSFGVGVDYQRKYMVSVMYNTATAALGRYTNGNFELGVRAFFGK